MRRKAYGRLALIAIAGRLPDRLQDRITATVCSTTRSGCAHCFSLDHDDPRLRHLESDHRQRIGPMMLDHVGPGLSLFVGESFAPANVAAGPPAHKQGASSCSPAGAAWLSSMAGTGPVTMTMWASGAPSCWRGRPIIVGEGVVVPDPAGDRSLGWA